MMQVLPDTCVPVQHGLVVSYHATSSQHINVRTYFHVISFIHSMASSTDMPVRRVQMENKRALIFGKTSLGVSGN